MMPTIENGPYLHAIGWTARPEFSVEFARSDHFARYNSPIQFLANGDYLLNDQAGVSDLLTPLSPSVMQSSGVARVRSAAKSTVFAALLGKSLLGLITGDVEYCGEQVGLAVTSSAITSIAWEFESVGLQRGWLKTDTMLLPSAIPSAICTQVSAALNIHASATAFQDGALGLCAAFELAYLSFIHERAQYFMLIGAEELCEVQHRALIALDENRPMLDGATGILLTKKPRSKADWQLVLCANIASSAAMVLPSSWEKVSPFKLQFSSHLAIFSSLLVPYALQEALSAESDRVLFVCEIPRQGTYVLGFQR